MFNWLFKKKEPYKYKGSSDDFYSLYTEIKEMLINDDINFELVLSKLNLLTHLMKTRGDGEMVQEVQARIRVAKTEKQLMPNTLELYNKTKEFR